MTHFSFMENRTGSLVQNDNTSMLGGSLQTSCFFPQWPATQLRTAVSVGVEMHQQSSSLLLLSHISSTISTPEICMAPLKLENLGFFVHQSPSAITVAAQDDAAQVQTQRPFTFSLCKTGFLYSTVLCCA